MQNRVQKTRWPEETAEQNTAASGRQPVWNSFLWFAYDTFIIPKTNPVTVWQHYNHPPSADRITTSTVLLCQLRHGILWYYARSNSVVIQTEDIKCVFCNCCQMCTLMWCRACSDDSRETETKKKKHQILRQHFVSASGILILLWGKERNSGVDGGQA